MSTRCVLPKWFVTRLSAHLCFRSLDSSQMRQLADCQLVDWTTRRLDIWWTGQLADWTSRRLDNSWMPPATVCLVFVFVLSIYAPAHHCINVCQIYFTHTTAVQSPAEGRKRRLEELEEFVKSQSECNVKGTLKRSASSDASQTKLVKFAADEKVNGDPDSRPVYRAATTVLQSLYRTTCVGWHAQLRTER